jgi:hypothetical protein
MVTNSMDFGGAFTIMAALFAVVVIFAIFAYFGSDVKRYKRLAAIIEKVKNTCFYAVVGGVVFAGAYAIYLVISALLSAAGEFDPIVIAYAIGGFAVLAAVGYLTVKIIDQFAATVNAAREEVKPTNPIFTGVEEPK